MSYQSSDQEILLALKSGDVLTPALAAQRWRCLALHSAVSRLRKLGHNIPCRMVTHGDRRHGEYRYVAPQAARPITYDKQQEHASAAPNAPSATDAGNPARRPAMMAEHVMANGKILRYMFE